MRFRLRTLLIALALGPPGLAGIWFGCLKLLPPSKGSLQPIHRQDNFAPLISDLRDIRYDPATGERLDD